MPIIVQESRASEIASRVWVFVALALLTFASTPPNSQSASAGSQPSNCDYQLGYCFQYGLASPHFVVFYNTDGKLAVTPEWAKNVSSMAEAAYAELVIGEGFVRPARDPIPIYLDRSAGGFTNFIQCLACSGTPGGLQNLQIEYRYRSPCPQDCGIPTSNWEVAHEVFHTIQFSQAGGRLSFGSWLSESSANWAGYTVTGNESRWDPWVISAWLGPNGTTDTPLLHRTYDNAFFLVFLSDHYGGAEIVKRIILNANLTNANDDFASQLQALGYRETLQQVMSEFGAAMLTGNFTDQNGAAAVLRQMPPIGATVEWTGTNQSVSTFAAPVNEFGVGDPLKVRVPYGIEYVRVQPASEAAISVEFNAQNASCFASKVVTRQGGTFATHPISQSAPLILSTPNRYDDIFVVVSRGPCSSGEFSVVLSTVAPGETRSERGPDYVFYFVLLGFVVALAVTTALARRRWGRGLRQKNQA